MLDAPLMLCAGEAPTDTVHQGAEQWVSRLFHGSGRCDAQASAMAVIDTPGAGDAGVPAVPPSLAHQCGRSLQPHPHSAWAAGPAVCLHAGATAPQPGAMHRLFDMPEGEIS